MPKENIRQELRLKNYDEAWNYFIEEIEQNELISNKYKKVCTTLSFCGYWMYFNFCFCLFAWYSHEDLGVLQ